MRCANCGRESAADFKFCPECGAPAAAPAAAREQRKVVTVLFCDVTGSTALGESTDPEALRALLARYFERMKGIVEAHGGTVEKFIGDAVMAVFGVPMLHEDDALRACRAACEMRDALPELGIRGRIGVNTGEVVTGTEERLATGDAVNVAARLEQAAAPGEVLIGGETLHLVAGAVEVEPVEPLALKGKSEPVPAFRLVAAAGEVERRHGAAMVGRERQRRLLDHAFQSVCDDRACHLFTVLGAAGVGKSRLVAEFLDGLDARVVGGRCPSYGDGIAYWPVVEVLKQLDAAPDDERAAAAIAAVLGDPHAAATAPEIAWAVRKTLEQAAAERPLVVVWDDLHWADPSFLDLIEHVADLSRDAPILLLCMARPEFLDRRAGWAGGKLNATTVLLEPLSAEETEALIDELAAVAPDLRARIRDAAEGNPLFVEEMLALAADSGGEVVVPPSIQALLAARLDQLDPAERSVLERGSVEGKLFHRGGVEALSDGAQEVDARLVSLVRKELVRPDRSQLAGDDAYRFRHLLIRDAAYDALPKSVRADLHVRFAAWLDEHGEDLVERDEIVGYHLEQAHRYRTELCLPDEAGLAAAARERLTAAAFRAMRLDAAVAATALLERAAALVPAGEADLEVEYALAWSLFRVGGPADAATRALDAAGRAGSPLHALCCRLVAAQLELFVGEAGSSRLEALVGEAAEPVAAGGDDLAAVIFWNAAAMLEHWRMRMDAEAEAGEHQLEHARRLRLRSDHYVHEALHPIVAGRALGSTPNEEVLAWIDELEAQGRSIATTWRSILLAEVGRFDEARAISKAYIARLREQGSAILEALHTAHAGLLIESLTGDLDAAERLGREGCRLLEQLGERSWLSTAAGLLGLVHCARGEFDAADEWAERGRELGAADDLATAALWREVRAQVAARRGDAAEGERLAREAISILAPTQHLTMQAMAYEALAEVLACAGRVEEAVAELDRAAALHVRKGNVVRERRVRARLAALSEPLRS